MAEVQAVQRTVNVGDILGAKDYREELIHVPAWGGNVKVRTLSMGARYDIATKAGASGRTDPKEFAVGSLQFGLVEPQLTREQAIKVVAEQSSETLQPIVDAVWRLSGLKESEAKNA